MKKTLLYSFFVLFLPYLLHAQQFEAGLDYYKNKEYQKAVDTFNQLKTAEGYLFTGKSFYALGKYHEAQSNLNNIPNDAPGQIYNEAMYTSGLINYQQKRYADALSKLYKVSALNDKGNLTEKAGRLYEQIVDYLTGPQRVEAIKELSDDRIKFDLLEAALGKLSFRQAKSVYTAFMNEADDDNLREEAREFDSSLSNTSSYTDAYGNREKLSPPSGTIYTIGMALPKYEASDREFEIVKAMYFGAMLAAEEFNKESGNARAYVQYTETGTDNDGLESAMRDFRDNSYGDIIIGPLFSEQAKPMVSIATDFQIPTIAPLANAQLNADNSYLFQANPPFDVHGEQMAEYAVNELEMKNFAVIAARNSNGEHSARAFRKKVQELGANINHFFVEDLESNEYEVSNYTKYFGSSAPVEAVYAPFTGPAALNLIDLLLMDIRNMSTSPAVLGSQEYQNLEWSANKYRNLEVLFSESTFQRSRGANVYRFKNSYERKFDSEGNQYAMVGYDVAKFILNALREAGNPALLETAMRNQPRYNGLVQDIDFNGGNVNNALKILEVTGTGNIRTLN